jgi:glycosyltransferase involved in cell wall biosynthesis
MEPLVSILIPAFNAERWIGEAIESALRQTWSTKEVVIVDDGSTDQTLPIARKFASTSVCVITQPNQGAARARNKAYSLSQGDYIQWLDADDVLAPDKISKQMELLVREGSRRTVASAAWGHFIHRLSKASFVPTPLWHDLSPIAWLLLALQHGYFMQTATWLVSRELTEAVGPWDTRLLGDDDGEYFCRVILASSGIRFLPQAKTFYRRTGASRLSYIGRSSKKLEAQFLSNELQVGYARAYEDSDRVRAACLAFVQRWLICFYPDRPDLVQQSQRLAADLGSRLEVPRLTWKYAWIQKIFGWTTAKRAQLVYNQFKSSVLSSWDAALFRLKI